MQRLLAPASAMSLPRRASVRASTLTLLSLLSANVMAIDLAFCSTSNTEANGVLADSYQFMSASRCNDKCHAMGTYAFAVVSGSECWCSDYAPFEQSAATDCLPTCPGWPDELCGGNGLFGYIAQGASPSGTVGQPIFSSPSAIPSDNPPPVPVTQTQFDTSFVVQTSIVTSTRVADPTPSSVTSSTTSSTTSSKPPPIMVSTHLVTVPGGVSTFVLTSVPTPISQPASQQEFPVRHSSGLSNGAVAGITIGAIAGAGLIGLLIFILCWRRRKSSRNPEGNIKRNTSVLSKVGLLRSGSTKVNLNRQPPMIQTNGLASGSAGAPASAGTLGSDSQLSENRRSRPLFVDQRLNPHAIFGQSNASRTSVGTFQDNQDYSRPLEIRNPD